MLSHKNKTKRNRAKHNLTSYNIASDDYAHWSSEAWELFKRKHYALEGEADTRMRVALHVRSIFWNALIRCSRKNRLTVAESIDLAMRRANVSYLSE